MIPFNSPNMVGDRVIYYAWDYKLNRPVATHSAIVTQVNKDGQATMLISKWGQGPLVLHHPRVIPASYGSVNPTYVGPNGIVYQSRIYFRRN
jgi:hypothetical protein